MSTTRRLLALALLTLASMALAAPAFASAAGNLEPNLAALEFPETGILDQATTLSTKVTNAGDEDASLGGLSVAAPFSIDAGNSECDDAPVLSPGSSCNLVVKFSPSAVGPATGDVILEYDDSVEPRQLEIPTSGSGAIGTLEAGSLNFNTQPYFFGGQQQQVSIANVSAFSAVAESATISGPDAAAFGIAYSGCNNNFLQPGNNCNIGVQFNPAAPGTYVAQIEVQNHGAVSPVVVPIEVEVLAGPDAVIDPDSIDFGVIEVGTAAPTQQVSVANEGDYPLQIQQLLVISGTPQAFPISNDGCSGQIVLPTEKCEITVGFAPSKAGERNASIFVIANTPGPVTISALSGEGMFAPNGSVDLTSQAKVGVPIVCLTSGYREADELSYQWLRDGSAIAGETQSVYLPVEADVGTALSCEVEAANPVGTQTVTSDPSVAVLAATPGPQGPTGTTGPQGPAGGTGPQGPTGATGLQGSVGSAGATGPAGSKGESGAAGPRGTTGPRGKAGKRGPRGKTGHAGCKARHGRSAQAQRKCGGKQHSRNRLR